MKYHYEEQNDRSEKNENLQPEQIQPALPILPGFDDNSKGSILLSTSSNTHLDNEQPTQAEVIYEAFTENFKTQASTGYKLGKGVYQQGKSFLPNQTFLTADQYEQSPYKIPGKTYPKGVAENIAKMRYDEYQETKRKEMVFSKLYAQYPKTTKIAAFVGGMVGALVDPAFLALIAASALCPPAGAAATTARLAGLTRWGVTAAKDISIGTTFGVLAGAEQYAKGRVYDEDVKAADILTSGLYGGMFGMGVTVTRGAISGAKAAWGKMQEVKNLKGDIHGAFISPASDLNIKIRAISQLEEGKQVDITPYFKAAASQEKYTTAPLADITSAKEAKEFAKDADSIADYEHLEAIASTHISPPPFEEFVAAEAERSVFSDNPLKKLAEIQMLQQEHLEGNIEKAIRDYVKNNKIATLDEGLQAHLAGITGRGISARDSIAAYVKARRNNTLLSFWEDLKKRGAADYFASKSPIAEIEIAKALRGEATDDALATQVAAAFKPLQEELRTAINNLGGEVTTKEGYITHFSHDPIKAAYTHETPLERLQYRLSNPFMDEATLNEVSFKRWKDTHLPLLDIEKTFAAGDAGISAEKQETALRNMFNRIVAREKYKDAEFGIAEKWSRSQFFVYKDAASFVQANRIYGQGNVFDAMINTLKGESQTIALAEKLGLNPKATFENVLEKLKRTEGMTPAGIKKLERQRLVFDNVSGFSGSPYDASSVITNNLLTWEYLTKAANITIASLNDVVHQIALQQKLFGRSTLGAALNTLRTQPKEFIRVLAESLGKKTITQNDLSVTAELARVMALDLHSRYNEGPVNKLAQLMNSASGINAWDTASIRHATICTARELFLNSRYSFDGLKKLNTDLRKTLLQYGIDSKDWDLIRKNPFKDRNGKGYITVDTSNYSKESVAQYLGKPAGEVTQKELEATKKQMRFKLLIMNQDVVDYYRLTPDAVEHSLPLMRNKDFLSRTFMQFKGYPVALTRRILSLVMENSIEGFRESGFVGIAKALPKDMIPVATYIGEGLALGYAANSLLRLTQGKTPLDPTEVDTWKKAAAYSGSGGLYATALEHLTSAHGNFDTLASLAGPIWADINHVGQIATKGIGEHKLARTNLYKLISGNLPLVNLPYIREAFNYLIGWRMFETMAPNAFRKMIKREQGSWIVDPREYLGS